MKSPGIASGTVSYTHLDVYKRQLKGSATDFGAVALAALCREIEAIGREGEVAAAASRVDAVMREYKTVEMGLKGLLVA